MQKILKFEKWLPKVLAVGFYNPDCILVNLSKIFGGIIPTYLYLPVCMLFFINFIYLIKKNKFKQNLYYKLCNSDKWTLLKGEIYFDKDHFCLK